MRFGSKHSAPPQFVRPGLRPSLSHGAWTDERKNETKKCYFQKRTKEIFRFRFKGPFSTVKK